MKIRMLISGCALGLSLGLCYLPPASALDVTPAVKVTPLAKATSSWNGAPVVYPKGQAEITGMLIEIAVGAQTGWHGHPVPSFALVLEGTLEVELRDGRKKRVGPGEALIEVVDTLHNGRNVGAQPVKLVVFYAGATGMPLTFKPDAANSR
jgi:quercetin dioxygenase-like cupin family protein